MGVEEGGLLYTLRKLVGPNGHMTGIDMTDEQVCPYWALNRVNSVYSYINCDISTNPMLCLFADRNIMITTLRNLAIMNIPI